MAGIRARRTGALAAAVMLPVALMAAVIAGPAAQASSPATPTATPTPIPSPTVTPPSTQPLPTAQLNGVAYAQVVVRGTVYVGGAFTAARPAGAARGQQTVRRTNLLAYDLATGRLTGWSPRTNGVVKALAVSSDGRTLYVAGGFTTVDGAARGRIAGISLADGSVRHAFHPMLNGDASALAVHGSTVYVGGHFTAVARVPRSRAAAVDAKTGALRRWAPRANGDVLALVVSKAGGSAVLGGSFDHVNGSAQRGSQRVDTGTGRKNLTWKVNDLVGNHGPDAAVYSLVSDGRYVYGTGYQYAAQIPQKRLEGAFVARWSDGGLHWIEDCHGDSYSIAPTAGVVLVAGHPHDCRTIGGFAETEPRSYRRALAFTAAATGRVRHNTVHGYSDFAGQPAPTLLDWYPAFDTGTATGQDQGPWDVVVSGRYVAYAGEFTTVDGMRQQGLVRFLR